MIQKSASDVNPECLNLGRAVVPASCASVLTSRKALVAKEERPDWAGSERRTASRGPQDARVRARARRGPPSPAGKWCRCAGASATCALDTLQNWLVLMMPISPFWSRIFVWLRLREASLSRITIAFGPALHVAVTPAEKQLRKHPAGCSCRLSIGCSC